MAADFTMTGRPSPVSAAAKKTVTVTMAYNCLADPSTLCSSRKHHSHSFPNKKVTFFSVNNHHAAIVGDSPGPPAAPCSCGLAPTSTPVVVRTEESGLLKVAASFHDQSHVVSPDDHHTVYQ